MAVNDYLRPHVLYYTVTVGGTFAILAPASARIVNLSAKSTFCDEPDLARFPIIERLQVRGYRVYPGADASGLDVTLGLGPWIVLGVNGLGKTTLLLLLRYLLVGNVRVRSPGFSGETKSDLFVADHRTFATRVSDGARDATAELKVSIGVKT